MTHRFNRLLLALLLLIGLPWYWLLIDNGPRDIQPEPLEIAHLRALAHSMPGPRPTGIASQMVAFGFVPGNLEVAGSGMKRKLIGIMAFRLERPGNGPVIIDSGMTRRQASAMEMAQFNVPAQERVDAQMREASLILLTGLGDEHAGGLVALANRANVLPRAALSRAQAHVLRPVPGPPFAAARESARAVAPGIVAIPTGHPAAGGQMIFVLMADGREYLFCGDVAPFAQSWEEQRGRSRLYTDYRRPEDRRAALAWLGAVERLKQQAPALGVIAGHDFEWLHDPRQRMGLTARFPEPGSPAQAAGQ